MLYLEEQIFCRTIFRQANSQGANLRSANLVDTNLSLANLQGADLDQSNLQGAILRDTDLRRAKSLPITTEEATWRGAIIH